jgi:hypothetical protein
MRKLNSLERRHVSLKGSCCLLQTRQRQDISDAQRALVVALVDGAICSPGARWVPLLGIARGGEPPLLPDEAERGDGRQPLKPRWRIGLQGQFAFLRTHDHIDPWRAVFDQWGQARPSAFFGGNERSNAWECLGVLALVERRLRIGNGWGMTDGPTR